MRQRTQTSTIRVFVVLYDVPGLNDGLGDRIARFHRRADAEKFAAGHSHWGRAATVDDDDVPAHIADRWSIN